MYCFVIDKSNKRIIMDDPFIRNHIEDLLKTIRSQVLLKLIKPYTRIMIPFISRVSQYLYSFFFVSMFHVSFPNSFHCSLSFPLFNFWGICLFKYRSQFIYFHLQAMTI
ncbi:hypothetical protein Dimus_015058 [Dionaea muscipula]